MTFPVDPHELIPNSSLTYDEATGWTDSQADAEVPGCTRSRLLAGSMLATAVLVAISLVLPTGFAVRGPGPTEDTLGEQNGVPLVDITGTETFPASGELRLTTVSNGGGPVSDVFALDVLGAWLNSAHSTLPMEVVFPPNVTRAEHQQQSAAQMITSQEQATAAALSELNIPVPATLTAAGFTEGSPSIGLINEGDVLQTLNGEELTTLEDLLRGLSAVTPGNDVVVGVERDGERLEVTITTITAQLPDGGTRAALGVFVQSDYTFPFDVNIQIENIGGPSAGLIFALAIIDLLTPDDELGGAVVAGSGTIDVDGTVGAIGGIEQKMHGARRDGATYFLAPAANCHDVIGQVPRGLRVVRVATLAEARAAITAIGAGTGSQLPTCEAD